MLARLVLFAVSLVVAATASADPLMGVWKVWQSDRDLTLLEVKKLASLTLEQREVLSKPDLFGQAVAIYGDREMESRLTEGSMRLSYRVVATGSDFVEIEYEDEQVAKPVRKRLLLHGGLLHVPIEDMGFHEIFRRIDAPAAPAP
jgi:hypothetical protein